MTHHPVSTQLGFLGNKTPWLLVWFSACPQRDGSSEPQHRSWTDKCRDNSVRASKYTPIQHKSGPERGATAVASVWPQRLSPRFCCVNAGDATLHDQRSDATRDASSVNPA